MVYKINIRYCIFLILIIILFFFGFFRCIHVAKTILNTTASLITYPFLRIQNGIAGSIEGLLKKRSTIKELEMKVERIQQEQQKLLAENISLHSQLDYLQENRELIQFQKRYTTYSKQLVQIIFRQFFDKGHFYIIDGGSKHGIEPDMIVAYKNCLIGRVTEVFPYYAKVLLITDHNFKVSAFCAATKTKGIYEGLNNLTQASLAHVSHLDHLQNDDLIISSGEGLIFPRGFGLGKIHHFSVDGVNYAIVLEPLVDLKNISYCYVMKKGSESQ